MSEVELTISAGAKKEASGLRLVATLTIAGMISGLALAGVYQITEPIIAANDARALNEAVFKVVPGAQKMQKLVLRDGALIAVGENEAVGDDPVIYGAYDDAGAFMGYAIENQGPGFQDTIRLLYGYDPVQKRVIGMEILESRETPGLGDKIFKDQDFVANFSALAVEPEIVVIKGDVEADNEVDAITGATISSKAVVKIINAGNTRWLEQLPAPGNEPDYIQPEPATPPTSGGGK